MTRRSWIWPAILLALCLSIAVNFFLIGYVAHGLREQSAGRTLMSSFASSYPPEVGPEFRRVLRENWPRTLMALRDLRAARAELKTATNASPFDEAAVGRAMQNVSKATTALQETMQGYLLVALKHVKEKSGNEGS